MNALTIGLSALAFAMRAVEVQLGGLGETHRASSGRCRWTLRGSKLRVSELERSCPMKYLPGYEALSGEAIASARTLLGQERPTPRAAGPHRPQAMGSRLSQIRRRAIPASAGPACAQSAPVDPRHHPPPAP